MHTSAVAPRRELARGVDVGIEAATGRRGRRGPGSTARDGCREASAAIAASARSCVSGRGRHDDRASARSSACARGARSRRRARPPRRGSPRAASRVGRLRRVEASPAPRPPRCATARARCRGPNRPAPTTPGRFGRHDRLLRRRVGHGVTAGAIAGPRAPAAGRPRRAPRCRPRTGQGPPLLAALGPMSAQVWSSGVTMPHAASTSSARVNSEASPSIASRMQRLVRLGGVVAERRAVGEVHVHACARPGPARAPWPRSAAGCPRRAGCASPAGSARARWRASRKSISGGRLNWTAISVARRGQPLAGAQVEGHVRPAPVLDLQLERHERLDRRAWGPPPAPRGSRRPGRRRPSPRCTARAPRRRRTRARRPLGVDGPQDPHLLVAQRVGLEGDGRLHGHQASSCRMWFWRMSRLAPASS